MKKIKIQKNIYGDSRTATHVPSIVEFRKSNYAHRKDVAGLMSSLADDIKSRGLKHDHTKTDDDTESVFYRELCDAIEGKIDFEEESKWYKLHCSSERHHLDEHCPDDVNLIDVIEEICDCVCAGMARSGEVRPVAIEADILKKAVKNTVQMCMLAIEIEGEV